jgi:hypothetical protein
MNASLFFDWSSFKLNHAAMNVESHLVSLEGVSERLVEYEAQCGISWMFDPTKRRRSGCCRMNDNYPTIMFETFLV